jgi:hypothetical protein
METAIPKEILEQILACIQNKFTGYIQLNFKEGAIPNFNIFNSVYLKK